MRKNKDSTNILLIEDNQADATLVRILLKDIRFKHTLNHVETLYEANDAISELEPDIVLLDLSLPDSNGFRTLTSFIEKNPHVPVVIMTGLNDDVVGNQAVKAGAQDYLIKGEFDARLLGRVLRHSLQRHKIQSKLEETAKNLSISERRYLEAQEMANFGNFELDLVNNEMNWTDEVFRILGYLPGSLRPSLSDYLNACHFEERTTIQTFFEKAAKDGNRHTLEHRIIINGRTIHYVLIHAKVYYDDITAKFLLVGGIQDVTERKVGEQLIIEKNIQSQSSKIKEEVLEDMSFHIRTPLSSILNLSYILSNTKMGNVEKELMKALKTSVDDLSISVNNMLNFSMLVSEKVKLEEEDIHLEDFVQQTKQLVQLKANQNRTFLLFDIDPNVPSNFKTDGNKLSQILYNLIDNGIKFTPDGGKVHIYLSVKNLTEDNFNLVLTIRDDGVGMSSDQVTKLLTSDELLLAHDENDKKQLGLAIVNKLAKNMNGSIDISSKQNKGSVFTVQIPVKNIKKMSIEVGDEPAQSLKILLVEDHFLNQIATKRVLTSWSKFVTVDIADNGLVGVDKFKEHGYDMILMDIQMPIMDGFEATKKIRKISKVPIIALTANSSKQEAAKCMDIGMNDYLAKPMKPDDLYAKIMTVLAKQYA